MLLEEELQELKSEKRRRPNTSCFKERMIMNKKIEALLKGNELNDIERHFLDALKVTLSCYELFDNYNKIVNRWHSRQVGKSMYRAISQTPQGDTEKNKRGLKRQMPAKNNNSKSKKLRLENMTLNRM